MNPYQILGVPTSATEAEIKAAYRQLAKTYHPDKNKSESAKVIIQRVNEAYEILSDPQRKAQYDQRSYMPPPPVQTEHERAHEAYVREYRRKKWEEQKRNVEAAKLRDQKHYRIVRMFNIPILLFAILLVVDQFLPPRLYQEQVTAAYTKREGGRHSYTLYFLNTKHFELGVPMEMYFDHDDENEKDTIGIAASPIFQIARTVTAKTPQQEIEFESLGTIYEIPLPFHYLLLISSLFVVLAKEYTSLRKSLCYLPILFLTIILVIMM